MIASKPATAETGGLSKGMRFESIRRGHQHHQSLIPIRLHRMMMPIRMRPKVAGRRVTPFGQEIWRGEKGGPHFEPLQGYGEGVLFRRHGDKEVGTGGGL